MSNLLSSFPSRLLFQKLGMTLLMLTLYRVGNSIPLANIDQEALKNLLSTFDAQNTLVQNLAMYTNGKTFQITPFSLGIIPFINASILVDLFGSFLPYLEKLQSEEGEKGQREIHFYKKALMIFLAIVQSFFLIQYLQPFLYQRDLGNLFLSGIQLVCGSSIVVWMTHFIDQKGIGNGTSIIILSNILIALFEKKVDFGSANWLETLVLLVLITFICFSQTMKVNIPLVSARQLGFLEEFKVNNRQESLLMSENGLNLSFNQAGIFPIIIASNLLPFFSLIPLPSEISKSVYYLLIILFNYFYTTLFWDPEKIAEKLRKASVSIVNILPGDETVEYLKKKVLITSILGGVYLSSILVLSEIVKNIFSWSSSISLLREIPITSFIIGIGICFDIQKKIKNYILINNSLIKQKI
jgi:preprotein translocase subunit SecY